MEELGANDTTPAQWAITLTGGATSSIETSIVHTGKRSLKAVIPVGGSFLALSDDFALPTDGWFSAEIYRYVVAASYPSYPKLQASLQILDSSNVLQTEYFMGADDSPLSNWYSAEFGPPGYNAPVLGPNMALHGRIRLYVSGVTVSTTVYWDSVHFLRVATPDRLADKAVSSRSMGDAAITTKTMFGTGMSAIQKGSSNPATPSTDDRNFRIFTGTGDRDTYWNGSYWVTTDLKSVSMINDAAYTAVSVTASKVGRVAHHGDLDWWLGRFAAAVFIGSPSDASNFWTLQLNYITAGNTSTTVASLTTAAIAANVWNRVATNTFSPVTAPATAFMLEVIANKTGSPGTLLVVPLLCFREIV
jgi:hypothetical protein